MAKSSLKKKPRTAHTTKERLLSDALAEACHLLVNPVGFSIRDIDGVIKYYADMRQKVHAWQILAGEFCSVSAGRKSILNNNEYIVSQPKPSREWKAWPGSWKPHYNGSGSPCDMAIGACSCGATHAFDKDPSKGGTDGHF